MASRSKKDLDTFYLIFNKNLMGDSAFKILSDKTKLQEIVNSLEMPKNKEAMLKLASNVKIPFNRSKHISEALETFYKNSPQAMIMDRKVMRDLVKADVNILKDGKVHPQIEKLQNEIQDWKLKVKDLQFELKQVKGENQELKEQLNSSLQQYNNLTRNLVDAGIDKKQIESWSQKTEIKTKKNQSTEIKMT